MTEVIPSSDFSPGLSPAQCEAVRATMFYDHTRGLVVWRERSASMFNSQNPAKTAKGWNEDFARKPVGVTVIRGASWVGGKVEPHWGRCDFRYKGVRYQLHMHDVYKLLAGRGLRTPIERKKRVSTWREDKLQDHGLIRDLIGVHDGVVRWKLVPKADWDRLAAARMAHLGHDVGSKGYAMYCAVKAGREVTANAQGFVSFGGGLNVAWSVICKVLGVKASQPKPMRQTRKNPAPEFLVRMLVEPDWDTHPNAYRWRPRGMVEWQAMALCGAVKEIPSAERMEKWNEKYGGKWIGEKLMPHGAIWPADLHSRAVARIGNLVATGGALSRIFGWNGAR